MITLGTPHHGSVHAWLHLGASLAQMRPGNAWLAALNRDALDPALPHRLAVVVARLDGRAADVVARCAGAENVALVGVGHNALLGDADVFDRRMRDRRRANGVATRRLHASRALLPVNPLRELRERHLLGRQRLRLAVLLALRRRSNRGTC